MNALVASLLGFAAGTLALQWQPVLPEPRHWLAAALALALVARAAHARCGTHQASALGRVARRAVLAGMLAAAGGMGGFGMAGLRAQHAMADALPAAWEGRDIAVVGVVDELPHASALGTRFAFAVERVVTPEAVVPSRLSLAWYARSREEPASDAPALRAGERWHLVVRLKRPHGNVNPHGFDVEAWLLENSLRATGYVREDPANARIDAFAGRPSDLVQRARERIRDRILRALENAPYAGVIVALAIGEQRAIPEWQWRVFNRTGITHLISISGLHVTVFAALAGALAHAVVRRSVRVTRRIAARRIAALAGAFAAFGYVLLAGAQVPAQRTLLMLIVAAMGLWLGRPGTARIVWLWALAVVLAVDPWAGLAPGLWLSFGAVGLLLYTGTGRLHTPARSWREGLHRHAVAAARAQFVVTVGLVPFTLAMFQQISVVAPLANALAIPVVTFGVVPLALLGIVVPVDLCWHAAHAVLAALMMPLEAMAAWPATTWQQHAPLPWTVVVAACGTAWLLAPRGFPLRPVGWLWLLPLFVVRPAVPGFGNLRVTVLDVGQGLAVLVQTHSHALLYDTGPRFSEDADAGGRIIVPYLRGEGVAALSDLVVSHLDSDHSGGARTLLQTVPARRVLTSITPAQAPFDATGPPLRRCEAGESWWWDGVQFTVLHPAPASYALPRLKTNDLSCVLRIESTAGTLLLTGDIEARSESAMIADGRVARVDVLVVPHHGSRTSSTPAFVAAATPRLAVFTPGYRNRFGHPRPEVLARYRDAGATLLRTDRHGAVTIDFDQQRGIAWMVERERGRRYWHDDPLVE